MDRLVLNAVLAEAGTIIETGAITAHDGGALWTFEFEDEAPLYLERSIRGELLILSGEVDALPEEARPKLFELLLLYNSQGPETGGARFAIDGPDGAVVLSLDIAADDLDVNHLAALVQDFRALRHSWRAIISRWPHSRPTDIAHPGLRV